jgi:hypothetical protein
MRQEWARGRRKIRVEGTNSGRPGSPEKAMSGRNPGDGREIPSKQ